MEVGAAGGSAFILVRTNQRIRAWSQHIGGVTWPWFAATREDKYIAYWRTTWLIWIDVWVRISAVPSLCAGVLPRWGTGADRLR